MSNKMKDRRLRNYLIKKAIANQNQMANVEAKKEAADNQTSIGKVTMKMVVVMINYETFQWIFTAKTILRDQVFDRSIYAVNGLTE